jgi:hypothetical protein
VDNGPCIKKEAVLTFGDNGQSNTKEVSKMGIDPMSAITGAKELVEAAEKLVELLKQIKGMLLGQPEPAAAALARALEEVSHTCEAIDLAIGQYLGVLFNPKQGLYDEWNVKARKELLALDSVTLNLQVEKARTKSGKIAGIYDEYLDRWFLRVFGRDKADLLYSAINTVWGHDEYIVQYLTGLVGWLSQAAKDTLDIVDKSDFELANRRILNTRKALEPFRQRLKEVVIQLYYLQKDFDDAAGVLGL